MSGKLNVGVVFGGRSTEHQVSLVSATSVLEYLNPKYEIIPIGIAPDGRWFSGDSILESFKKHYYPNDQQVVLPADPTDQHLRFVNSSKKQPLDVVFPVLHGTFGEDGAIQGLLEMADLPYVGAGVLGSAVSMDKIAQKQICSHCGLPVVDYLWFRAADWHEGAFLGEHVVLRHQLANMNQEQMLETILNTLELPVFVKPANLGSSVGISKAKNLEQLRTGILAALQYDRKILLEAAVEPALEVEVAVMGNEHPRAAMPGQVIPSNEFYDYDAKYVDNASGLRIPADISDDLIEAVQLAAIKAVTAVDVQGLARVDFLVNPDTERFYLNELNTLPGFTAISMYPKLWEYSGFSYSELLDELIKLAVTRYEDRQMLQTMYRPKSEWYKE